MVFQTEFLEHAKLPSRQRVKQWTWLDKATKKLLADLRGKKSDLGSGDEKKALKITSWLDIFRAFFFSFLISPEQTVR